MAPDPPNPRLFSSVRARAFAARLDVEPWSAGICLACLSFVVFPLDDGDERGALASIRRLSPDLWAEGLDEYAFAVVRAARDDGVRDAEEALADLTLNGASSAVARALVRRLADVEVERLRAGRRGRGAVEAAPVVELRRLP